MLDFLWYLGSDNLREVVTTIATEQVLTLIDSSEYEPIMERVWVRQTAEPKLRGKTKKKCLVVMFVNIPDFDSETIVVRLLFKLHEESRFIFIVAPNDISAKEGYMHYEGAKFKIVMLDSLEANHVRSKILEVL